MSSSGAHAQSDDALLKQKDAQIADLQAQIAQLKAQMGQTAPAAASTTTTAPSTATSAPNGPAPMTSTTSTASATDDSLVKMSAFEVRTTQGSGYSQGNSASGLKTSEPIMNIPAQMIVLSHDVIDDVGSHTATDVLAYGGVAPYYRGPAVMVRGNRIQNPYIDDVPQAAGIGESDNTNIDSYSVIKGPEQVLYPLASLGGLVLENTKKPLPNVTQITLDEQVQQWGRQTFTFDANIPAPRKLGDVTVTARVEGIAQSGAGAFHNTRDDRYGIFPNLAFDWHNTSVILEYDAEVFHYLPGGTGILAPNGNVNNGGHRRNENTPPNDLDKNEQHDVRLEWTQKLSDNWQVKTQGAYFSTGRYGSAGYPSTVNYNNNTITYTIRKDSAWNTNLTAQSDVSGKYEIAKIPMTTAFGFNTGDQLSYSKYLPTAPTVTIPMNNLAAVEAIVFPNINSYPLPASGVPGSRSEQYVTNGYLAQTIDVIPNWLTLIGGLTFSKIETVTDSNIAVASPYTATDLNGHETLHRFGAVAHLTNQVSAYVSEATTFTPSTGVNYQNTPLAAVLGKNDEVGLKVSLWDGKISGSVAAYRMSLTNQSILAPYPAVNVAGSVYYIPIGTTTSHGWDASMELDPVTGLSILGTAYVGTVRDPKNNTITGTYGNSWSLLTKYQFQPNSGTFLQRANVGFGAYRIGSRYFTMTGLVLPGGAPLPVNSSGNSVFKLKEGTMTNGFLGYKFTRNWEGRVLVENVLNSVFPIGAQGVGLVDPVDPRTFTFEATYRY